MSELKWRNVLASAAAASAFSPAPAPAACDHPLGDVLFGLRGHPAAECTSGREMPSSTPQTKPIVYVVDDDCSVREALKSLICSAGWRPKTFDCARTFLCHQRANVPNCLILDVNLPDLNGLELQKLVSAGRTDTPIIFVTAFGDVPMSVKAMREGAFEFLTKPFRTDVLLGAVKQALECSSVSLKFELEMSALRRRYASLSNREQQVMGLVASGMLNKQVGFELGISEITVKAHRGNVMRKMMAASFAQLISMAAQLQLVKQWPEPKAKP